MKNFTLLLKILFINILLFSQYANGMMIKNNALYNEKALSDSVMLADNPQILVQIAQYNHANIEVLSNILNHYHLNINVLNAIEHKTNFKQLVAADEDFRNLLLEQGAAHGALDIVTYILENYYKNQDHEIRKQMTTIAIALNTATTHKQLAIIKYILENYYKNQDLSSQRNLDIASSLIIAAQNGSLDIVEYMLENYYKNQDIAAQEELGVPIAFVCAFEKKQHQVIKYMLDNYYTNQTNAKKQAFGLADAFIFADEYQKIDLMKYILQTFALTDLNLGKFIAQSRILSNVKKDKEFVSLMEKLKARVKLHNEFNKEIQQNKNLNQNINSLFKTNLISQIKIYDLYKKKYSIFKTLPTGEDSCFDTINTWHKQHFSNNNNDDIWSVGITLYEMLTKDNSDIDTINYGNDFKYDNTPTIISNTAQLNQVIENTLQLHQTPKFLLLDDTTEFGKIGYAGLIINQKKEQIVINYANQNQEQTPKQIINIMTQLNLNKFKSSAK